MLPERLQHPVLKARQRELRDGFPVNLGLRVHRGLSWLDRGNRETGDNDAAFVFYWIAFNALYAEDIPDDRLDGRTAFRQFFERLIALDRDNRIYNAIWFTFSQSIRVLLDNRYVFQPFWDHHNGLADSADWAARFEASRKRLARALSAKETDVVLSTVFDRLYVLRNQVVHGGATWNGGVNRAQVHDGAAILRLLVPLFIDIMMDHPDQPWGPPHYPVVD
ncbi:MAG: hypothetical protein VYB54_00220 [Pseudomonadota bacterium]|nr:hypothetical protein [Pseudomonadota bacterium]